MTEATGSHTLVGRGLPSESRPLVRYERLENEVGAFASLTMTSDHNRNALSSRLVAELLGAFERAASDRVNAVVLQAEGKAFCSGADLAEAMRDGMEVAAVELTRLIRVILAHPLPVVARVHGPVRAGGLGIIAACDVVIAADDVTYAFTEARLGLTPAVISVSVLPRMTPRCASLTFLAGGPFDGRFAVDSGLITLAVPRKELDEAVTDVLQGLLSAERQGLEETKFLLNRDVIARLDSAREDVVHTSARLFASSVARVHMRAFLDRVGRRVPDSVGKRGDVG